MSMSANLKGPKRPTPSAPVKATTTSTSTGTVKESGTILKSGPACGPLAGDQGTGRNAEK